MTTKQVKQIILILKNNGIYFENGLSDNELSEIELKFDLKFPPDLKCFLQTALPVSENFVNWRKGLILKETEDQINSRLNWPLEGLLFDLQSNNFWADSWGEIPDNAEDKITIANRHYISYPKLIPIYSHRYIPSLPSQNGNPIFSIYQMDIIYYGYDLATYFANEFKFVLPSNFNKLNQPVRKIEFWSDWAE